MEKSTKNVSTLISALFPTAGTAISQKLSAEEMLGFASDVQEIDTRLEAQTAGNLALKGDIDALKVEKTTIEGQLAQKGTEITDLQAKVDGLTPYKTQIEGNAS